MVMGYGVRRKTISMKENTDKTRNMVKVYTNGATG